MSKQNSFTLGLHLVRSVVCMLKSKIQLLSGFQTLRALVRKQQLPETKPGDGFAFCDAN